MGTISCRIKGSVFLLLSFFKSFGNTFLRVSIKSNTAISFFFGFFSRCDGVFCCDAELFEACLGRCRSAERRHTDEDAVVTENFPKGDTLPHAFDLGFGEGNVVFA